MPFESNLEGMGQQPGGQEDDDKPNKWKYIAYGTIILMLASFIPLTYFWRKSSDQAETIRQLQESLDTAQQDLLEAVDTEAELNERIKELEEKTSDLEENSTQAKVEAAIALLPGEMDILVHPNDDDRYYFTDMNTNDPVIWEYNISEDRQYEEAGEPDVAGARESLFGEEGTEPFNLLKIEGNELAFAQDSQENMAGSCYSPWLADDTYTVDLNDSDPEKEPHSPEAEKLEQERESKKECEESNTASS